MADDIIQEFADYLTLELNYSPLTVAAYADDLRQWQRWSVGASGLEFVPGSVTVNDVRSYIAFLSSEKYSQRSIRRKIQAMRSFFKYLMRHHGLPSNPASRVTLARLDKPLPVYIREQEINSLLDQKSVDDPGDYVSARNRLIMDILYTTGMRVSELCALTVGSIRSNPGVVKVMGKRRKERIIPFGPELKDSLISYKKALDATWGKTSDPGAALFLNRKGMPMSRASVYQVVHNTLLAAGAHAPRLSPHVLRHCCATDLLKHGASMLSVKSLLGHASLASTQIYTHLSFKEIKDAYDRAHPRGTAPDPG